MSDPMLPLNCPRCGVRLVYRGCVNNLHLYTCNIHGEHWLDINGFLRAANDNENSPSTGHWRSADATPNTALSCAFLLVSLWSEQRDP